MKIHRSINRLLVILPVVGGLLLVGCAGLQRSQGPKIDPTKFALYEHPIDMRFHFATDTPTEGYMKVTDENGQVAYVEPIPLLTEQDVVSAQAQRDSMDQPCVMVTFNDAAGARLAEITGESIGEKLAVFVDDELVVCPKIMSPISTKTQITGNFTQERAQQIASALSNRKNQ